MTTVESQGKVVRIGVLGCGNVGAAFVRLVEQQGATIQLRTGIRLEVVSVAVRNMSRDRDVQLPEGLLTRDAHAVVADPSIDLIVEVIGGIEPARELITAALAAGNFAAVDAMAQLVGEQEFSLHFHKGETESIHFSKVNGDILLITIFGNDISLGFVRLKTTEVIDKIKSLWTTTQY